jgi:hypothetical protein
VWVSKAIARSSQTKPHPPVTAIVAEHIDSPPSHIDGGTVTRHANQTAWSPNELTERPTHPHRRTGLRGHAAHMNADYHTTAMNSLRTRPEGRTILKPHHAGIPTSHVGTGNRCAMLPVFLKLLSRYLAV